MAVPIATFIGAYITDTALPLFIGFFICGIISLLLIGHLYHSNKRKALHLQTK
jgi:DHA1 family bicyclomycin/chloramphenicol resistance-like MFS transporter